MKATLLLLAFTSSVFAATPILPRPTAQNLADLRQATPMDRLEKTATPEARVVRAEEQSLIQQSLILNDGTHWTLVPRGAVISLPQILKARLGEKPVGTLLTWIDFLTLNRGWITTHEVSLEQAAGKAPLPAESVAFWTTQDKLVIAVYQGGPISVLPATETLVSTRP